MTVRNKYLSNANRKIHYEMITVYFNKMYTDTVRFDSHSNYNTTPGCSSLFNSVRVVFLWGCHLVTLSSCEVVLCDFVFLWGRLPVRSYPCKAVFLWEHFPASFSCKFLILWCCLPMKWSLSDCLTVRLSSFDWNPLYISSLYW